MGIHPQNKIVKKKILWLGVSFLLVAALVMTSCGEAEPGEQEEYEEEEVVLLSAQEIIDGVIESFDNIRTYQFDMDMTQNQAGETEGEALNRL